MHYIIFFESLFLGNPGLMIQMGWHLNFQFSNFRGPVHFFQEFVVQNISGIPLISVRCLPNLGFKGVYNVSVKLHRSGVFHIIGFYKRGWIPLISNARGPWFVLHQNVKWFLVCLAPGFSEVGSLVIPVVLGLSCSRIFRGWVPCYSSGSWSILRPDFQRLGPLFYQWFLVYLEPGFSEVGSLVIPVVLGLS